MPTHSEQQLDLLEPTTPSQESLPSEQTLEPRLEDEHKTLYLDMEPLTSIASGKAIRVPRNPQFSRKDVVAAFQQSFELIGGVPRLALWANDNESEFFKLYARLLPSQASNSLGEANVLKIEMSIKPGPLDE